MQLSTKKKSLDLNKELDEQHKKTKDLEEETKNLRLNLKKHGKKE